MTAITERCRECRKYTTIEMDDMVYKDDLRLFGSIPVTCRHCGHVMEHYDESEEIMDEEDYDR